MANTLGSPERPLRVAVVGSGPSGFYAIGALFKSDHEVEVDLFDRLPTPFGLVRGGVAPDHQKIKNVVRIYDKTAAHEKFRFFGNVKVGRDVSVEELLEHYDQVVLAVGNESDRSMGIPGEDLEGVYSATEFVGWYNGHPDFQDRSFGLDRATRVGVVGNGNVSMDVTRILAQSPDDLAETDITDTALEALRNSSVRDIYILGRRGPAQAAFSSKEIREIGELETATLCVDPEAVDLDELSTSWLETQPRSSVRNVEYLQEKAGAEPGQGRNVHCKFLVSPVELLGEDGKLRAARIQHNELYASDDGTPRPRGTDLHEELELDLVFKAVGYRGVPIEGVPFHERWGTFHNEEGRITEGEGGAPIPRLYVVGWAKRGPSGLIGTNGPDSQATVAKMLEDLDSLADQAAVARGPESIASLLESREVDWVTYEDWQKLDAEEVRRGEAKGKVREKFTDVASMMTAIGELRG
ncbi:MAG: FAD-dependent oxidoreductase [Acidobacteriota bacterium]